MRISNRAGKPQTDPIAPTSILTFTAAPRPTTWCAAGWKSDKPRAPLLGLAGDHLLDPLLFTVRTMSKASGVFTTMKSSNPFATTKPPGWPPSILDPSCINAPQMACLLRPCPASLQGAPCSRRPAVFGRDHPHIRGRFHDAVVDADVLGGTRWRGSRLLTVRAKSALRSSNRACKS